MRVLVVHNRYQQRGGEDAVYESEVELLRSNGVEVETLEFDNSDIPSDPTLLQRLDLAASTVWSRHGYQAVKGKIRAFRPQVAHFHNTFPLISPAAYYAAKEEGVRVIQTLHNYRIACLNGLLLRDGVPCEACVGETPVSGIRHRCYRGSRSASAAVAAMQTAHAALRTWQTKVDVFIALTEFAKRKFVVHGLPGERIVVKPNFVEDCGYDLESRREGFLFLGRLSEEKGVRILLDAVKGTDIPLDVVGGGPLAEAVARAAATMPNVHYHGLRPSHEVHAFLKRARALVLPSIWYEGFPRTIAEAYASGTPVIASKVGGLPEWVKDGETGRVLNAGDTAVWRATLQEMNASSEGEHAMRSLARLLYETNLAPKPQIRALLRAYGRSAHEVPRP